MFTSRTTTDQTVDERTLVRDMWPKDVPQLVKDTKGVQEYSVHDLIPESLEGLMAWCYVRRIQTGDPSRRFALVHAVPDVNTNECEQVVFRFQGIVLNADLRPLGTWKE